MDLRKGNKRMKYLGVFCLIGMVAFGLLGISYSSFQQNSGVAGGITTGIWDSVNYASIDVSAAPNCTLISQDARTFTLKIHFSDSLNGYSGSVSCPIANTGTIPVIVDTVQITKTGPSGDPSGTDLYVGSTGVLVTPNNTLVKVNRLELAGLILSGNPCAGDYYVKVAFTTKLFNR